MTIPARSFLRIPNVKVGDYGWCILESLIHGEPPQLIYYDDDGDECSDGRDEEDPMHKCSAESFSETLKPGECYRQDVAIIRPSDLVSDRYATVEYSRLYPFAGDFDFAAPATGFIYAIVLAPEMDTHRWKVGFTKDLSTRIRSYRTANPTLMLVGAWSAEPSDEDLVLRAVDGRIGRSEVFVVSDPVVALAAIRRTIKRERLEP